MICNYGKSINRIKIKITELTHRTQKHFILRRHGGRLILVGAGYEQVRRMRLQRTAQYHCTVDR